MKESIKIIATLTIVCLLCALALSLVHFSAAKKIDLNAVARIENAINTLYPQAASVKPVEGDDSVFTLLDKQDKVMAYAFLAKGQGYQGTIVMLAVSNAGLSQLEGLEIIESLETPGLGAKIQNAPFRNQFKGAPIVSELISTKEKAKTSSEIEAITGATVSSRAVVNILNKKIALLRNQLKK